MKAAIFEIQKNSFVDGPGIRTTVFFKGCNMKCKWCHNPESRAFDPQMLYYKTKCTQCGICRKICPEHLKTCSLCGKCISECPVSAREICGREYTVREVFDEIVKDKLFYETSGGGVTFSGGECMLQTDFLAEILKICKEDGIHTCIDTAGNVPWANFKTVIPYADMFLYDVKAVTESLHIEGTGVSNRRILKNLKRLSDSCDKKIIIRIPLIPAFNTDIRELKKISDFLQTVNYESIEILPYHKMGEEKYNALNMAFTDYPQIDDETIENAEKILN